MTTFPADVISDPRFRVQVLSGTICPNQTIWAAMHQCYSEQYVFDENCPEEEPAGAACVKHLLASNRGHFGPLEHPQLTFTTGGFPHSVMQQARTHRVGVSFDVQSMRYTGARMQRHRFRPTDATTPFFTNSNLLDIEELVYFRPIGFYHDRQGKKYEYTEHMRQGDKDVASHAIEHYTKRTLRDGVAEEHARGLLPFDFRQNFVVSFNLRSLMHFLTVRGKADAQLEIRQLCIQMLPHFASWTPEIYEWFMANQWLKGRLAP